MRFFFQDTRIKKAIILVLSAFIFPLFSKAQGDWGYFEIFRGRGGGGGIGGQIEASATMTLQKSMPTPLYGFGIRFRFEGNEHYVGQKELMHHFSLGMDFHPPHYKTTERKPFVAIPIDTSKNNSNITVPYSVKESVSTLYFSTPSLDYYLYSTKNGLFSCYARGGFGFNFQFYKANFLVDDYDKNSYLLQPDTFNISKTYKEKALMIMFDAGFGMDLNLGYSHSIFTEANARVSIFGWGVKKSIAPIFTTAAPFYGLFRLGYRYNFD